MKFYLHSIQLLIIIFLVSHLAIAQDSEADFSDLESTETVENESEFDESEDIDSDLSEVSESEVNFVLLSGTITNQATGQGIGDVMVSVSGENIYTTTDFDGNFSLEIEKDKDITIEITHSQYQSHSKIILGHELSEKVSVSLQQTEQTAKEEIKELDKITVQETKHEAPDVIKTTGTLSKVSMKPESIKKLPTAGETDISRAIQLLPGVSGSNESSAGLYIRGGTPDQNLMLFDDYTVYNVDHFFGFFSTFNTNTVGNIDVMKGGFSAKYGGRASSVVNITSKVPQFDKIRATSTLSFLSADINAEFPLGGIGGIMLSARRSYSDIVRTHIFKDIFQLFYQDNSFLTVRKTPFGDISLELREKRNDAFHFFDINAKGIIKPTDNSSIVASLYFGKDDFNNNGKDEMQMIMIRPNGDTLRDTTVEFNVDDLSNWGNIGSSVKWQQKWSDRVETNLVGSFSKYFSEDENLTVFDTNSYGEELIRQPPGLRRRAWNPDEYNDVQDYTVKLDNSIKFTENNTLEAGIAVSQLYSEHSLTVNDTTIADERNETDFLVSGYIQDSWTIADRIILLPGFRLSYFQGTHEYYIEPRAAIQFKFNDLFRIKAGGGLYNQYLNRVVREDIMAGSTFEWRLANADSCPVLESQQIIAGATFEHPQFVVDLEGYYKSLDGLAEYSLARYGYVSFENKGTGKAMGVELLLQKPSGIFNGWVSYTLSQVEHSFPLFDKGEPFPALHDQPHELKAVANFTWKRLNISHVGIYATGTPYSSPMGLFTVTLPDGTQQKCFNLGKKNGKRLPDYKRIDWSISYDFKTEHVNTTLGFSAFNVFNWKNVWQIEFEPNENGIIEKERVYMGFTPSLFVNIDFKSPSFNFANQRSQDF